MRQILPSNKGNLSFSIVKEYLRDQKIKPSFFKLKFNRHRFPDEIKYVILALRNSYSRSPHLCCELQELRFYPGLSISSDIFNKMRKCGVKYFGILVEGCNWSMGLIQFFPAGIKTPIERLKCFTGRPQFQCGLWFA